MARSPIPNDLKYKLFYQSQYACVVCQSAGCHIHHIDRNPSNNAENNLVVLCTKHHDEAHTRRELSKNLDKKSLKDAKVRWLRQVSAIRLKAGTLSGQKTGALPIFSVGMSWGYINHGRVPELQSPKVLKGDAKKTFEYCVSNKLVDRHGILIKPKNVVLTVNYVGNTIYRWYNYGDDQRIHFLYSALVDQIVRSNQVIHIDENSWSKSKIKSLAPPGTLIMVNKAFYFKAVTTTKENQHRTCRTFKRNLEIEFFLDTRNMHGTSSVAVSFAGHRTCAALLLVKSLEAKVGAKVVLHCTPIALGIGFKKFTELA